MTKVLITGVTGSGGSYLAEYLCEHVPDAKVIGTTRDYSLRRNIEKIENQIEIKLVDFNDSLSVYRMLDEVRPDVILHIASIANVRRSFDNPTPIVTNNVNITLNLLECVRLLKNKDGYNPVIQICSTSEVYGNVDPIYVPITEDCPIKPINPYAVSKMTQDFLGYVYFLNYGMKIIRTRMFSYWNARRGDLFATAFAKQILEIKNGKRKVLEHGNLESIRSFIDAREAAESYWVAAQKCKYGEVYNIGGTEPLKIKDCLDMLIKKMGVEVITKQNQSLMRPSDVSVQIPNITKFTTETGWEPKIKLDECMDFFVEEIYKFWDK
jgi:GDP-mannose 4,6-dehydratase